ncbi:DUF5615 family PIN-like protein [Aquiflexum sp. TKW24L]|uniref:DUF5615 family PIN-like protein n=1 Tax=Aquiflexum sp. TKW24L TaxID=2942212 RepID=UPI0020BF1522|nr:DUF5615 family PIN-like protein [Aquiflexum sp. TKW24L]MCL6260382.1 DUF5615 family PIN-like protein [Aquiflexum sp. TKW24L]
MKILIDENLSWRIKKPLIQFFTEITHISDFKKLTESDQQIWDWSRKSNYSILTKDSDFYFLSVLNGCPPKVIRLKFGNMSIQVIIQKIISNIELIQEFLKQDEDCYLEIN